MFSFEKFQRRWTFKDHFVDRPTTQRVMSTLFTKTSHSPRTLRFFYHASKTSITRYHQDKLFVKHLDTHTYQTHIQISPLSLTVLAYSVEFLWLTSLGYCSVRIAPKSSESSLLTSTCHQAAESFEVLKQHSILDFFLGIRLSFIWTVCFIVVRIYGKHVTTLCVLVIVAILLRKQYSFIGNFLLQSIEQEGRSKEKQQLSKCLVVSK